MLTIAYKALHIVSITSLGEATFHSVIHEYKWHLLASFSVSFMHKYCTNLVFMPTWEPLFLKSWVRWPLGCLAAQCCHTHPTCMSDKPWRQGDTQRHCGARRTCLLNGLSHHSSELDIWKEVWQLRKRNSYTYMYVICTGIILCKDYTIQSKIRLKNVFK